MKAPHAKLAPKQKKPSPSVVGLKGATLSSAAPPKPAIPTDPIKGLKDALKAREVAALAAEIAGEQQ